MMKLIICIWKYNISCLEKKNIHNMPTHKTNNAYKILVTVGSYIFHMKH